MKNKNESVVEENEKIEKKSKTPVVIISVCIIAVIAAFALMIFSFISNSKAAAKKVKQQVSEVSVKTVTAQVKTLHDYVNTNGEISTQSSIDVFPDIGGKIYKVNVSLGSNVKKGEVVAEIDPSEPGAVYAHSPVYAPISGTVTATPLKQGTKVSVATTITTIGDVDNLQITANIPERYVSTLKTGLKADVVLESYPNEIFKATVTRVSPVVDRNSRTKEIILNFDKKNSKINAGMFAKVTLFTLNYAGKVVVPSKAIVEKNGKNYVFVVNEDNATVSQVEINKFDSVDNEIQITGVEVGKKIVVEGMRILSDGAKIIDVDNKKSENAPEGNK